MNKKRKRIISSCEISELKTYKLGGYNQKVLIEGRYKSNPIVIFLHGGPGFPIPFCEGCRGLFPEFTERFIMVYWDQLGCGINNHMIDDSFSSDTYVQMTVDLINELKKDFPDNTISLFGASWGSILAAKTAERVPELLHRVLTYGQVLKQLSINEEVFAALESSDMPAKQRIQLENIKNSEQRTVSDLKTFMRWVQKYTEGYQAKAGGKMPLLRMILQILASPDYSFKDFKAIAINGYKNNNSLLTELMNIDISDILRNIRIPYLILQGDTDIVTPTNMITKFVEALDNSNISIKCIQNSGHLPSKTGMDYIVKEGFAFIDDRY